MSASSSLSDPYVAAAFWTGAGALLMTLLLGLQIVHMRIALRRREGRKARALAKWLPLLNAAIVGEPPQALPRLRKRERLPFLKLWVHLQASLRGDVRDALNDIARRLELDASARAMLVQGRRAERLLAVLVLGYLRDASAWPQLLRLVSHDDHTLSLNAAWALVRIDPQAASERIMPLLFEREDWALSHVVATLQEARDTMAAALARALPQLDPARLPRALRVAEALRVQLPADMRARVLHSASVPVIIAGLRSVLTVDAIGEVRALLMHEDWRVRVQAVKAFSRIGNRDDVATIAPLLQDAQWWVRYRAAQSLLELPALSAREIEALHSSLSDRFAADMLMQAMAEKGMT